MMSDKPLRVIPSLQVLDNAIQNGLKYLRSVTDVKGGVPNHSLSDPSGAWTTCEVLSTIWRIAPSYDTEWILRLADYVLQAQLEDGSWPIVDRPLGTTASTAAGVLASLSAIELGRENSHLRDRAAIAVDKAIQWLYECQNKDLGWGMAKLAGEISKSRVYATLFALRALSAYRKHSVSNRTEELIEQGILYLEMSQNPDGGWGETLGSPSTVASTAGVLGTLSKLGVNHSSAQIIKGVSFITDTPDNSPAMAVFEEIICGEANSIVVHHNTPYTLLKMLLTLKICDRRVNLLTDWLVRTQLQDGNWKLRCYSTGVVRTASTWVTVETVYLLDRIRFLLVTDRDFLVKCSLLE